MKLNFFPFVTFILALSFFITSCGEESDLVDPCALVICAEGQVLTADCNCITPAGENSSITKSGFINTNEIWTSNNTYNLLGKVVVPEGTTLTIEAGTIIKGNEGVGTLASSLIIAQGGKLIANGTADQPIIFTSTLDNIVSGQILSPNLVEADNQLWGGLIILGRAPISAADGDNIAQIEGIPADDTYGRYGGDDPADNSGIIKYVSVRHGGALIGADNEINGITFGGVGNGTVVENIEVVANKDDGVEFFGGTVNVTNLVVANGEDDGIDIDQNYSGTIDNAIVVQSGATAGDNALEIDGPEGSLTNGLFTINNLTLIDEDGGSDTGGDLKSKAQGTINNASWRGFTDNVKIRASFSADCIEGKDDAYSNYIEGTLKITNSEWVGDASIADWTTVYSDRDADTDGDGEGDAPCDLPTDYQSNVNELLNSDGNQISTVGTIGADASVFQGWSWTHSNGKLN